MFRLPNEANFMISPIRGPNEIEESTHSDAKKSRNRHLVIINQLRKREDAWDNRFYLQNIPEYNCADDRHCETYKKILVKKKSKKFVLRKEMRAPPTIDGGMRRKLIDDSPHDSGYKRPESHDRPPDLRLRGMYPRDIKSREKVRGESMRRHTPLNEAMFKEKKIQEEKLLTVWERMNIPMFHRETFLKCENPQNVKQTIEILKKEIDDLEGNSSPLLFASRAITARENCLKQLKTLTGKFENISQEDQGQEEEQLKQKASELLTHLRILSLNAVETILRWREYIQQAYYITRGVVKANQTIIIPFLYHDTNYLIKMKNDTRELVETPLVRYFNFSSKSDPFLVYPSREAEQNNEKIVLYISKSLINRIRACELVILEESVHEHINEKSSASINKAQQESPSDRSLQNDDQTIQKKPSIKIRNTNLVTSNQKKLTAGYQPVKSENGVKGTNSSHGDSQSHVNDAESDKKKENGYESYDKTNENNHIDAQNQPQASVTSPKEAVKARVASPKKVQEVPVKESESPKKIENTASSTCVKPVDLYEDEVEEFLQHYLESLDQAMKDSFLSDPHVLLERANMGQDPTWFELVDSNEGGKKVGLAVAHIDNTVFTTRRLVILHFTSNKRDSFQDLLGKFVDYLWLNDECNEIKICLYHLEDENNNFAADKQLQENIKKLGFRWKQLVNDKNTGKRYIDYIIKRPENIVSQVLKNNDEPIHVKSVVVVSDMQSETVTNIESKYIFDNRYAVLSAVLKHCDDKIEKLAGGESKRARNYLQVIGSLVREGQAKIGDLTGKFQNLQEMETFVGEKFEDKREYLPDIDTKYSANIFTTSMMNLIYRWKSFNITHHHVAGKDRKYLKINNNSDLVQFQSKHKNTPMYFIPTDDNEVNIFVTDNDEIINDIVSKNEIMEEVISKLFSKLEKTPTSFQEDLWLPLFGIKDKNIDLPDAKSLLEGEYKINFATNTCNVSINGSRVEGNLKVRPSSKSKIIEKPFLFGILHEQVDFPLFTVLVQPEDFLPYGV